MINLKQSPLIATLCDVLREKQFPNVRPIYKEGKQEPLHVTFRSDDWNKCNLLSATQACFVDFLSDIKYWDLAVVKDSSDPSDPDYHKHQNVEIVEQYPVFQIEE